MATNSQAAPSPHLKGVGSLFEKARRLLDEGHLIESERVFDQAAAQGGDRSDADYFAGVVRLKLGDADGVRAGSRGGGRRRRCKRRHAV